MSYKSDNLCSTYNIFAGFLLIHENFCDPSIKALRLIDEPRMVELLSFIQKGLAESRHGVAEIKFFCKQKGT
jgi:hypothetical protein